MSKLNNDVRLIGNLGADPEGGQFDNGNAYVRFRIAVNDSYKDKSGEWVSKAVWVSCKAFGPTAERLTAQLSKGNTVMLSGKLQLDEWQDKQGNKRSSTYVLVSQAKKLDLVRRESEPAPSTPVAQDEADESEEDLPF